MQQSLLDNLSKATTDTTIKSKIVAIRDALNNTSPAAVAKPPATEQPAVNAPVLPLSGSQTLYGVIGTYTAKPTITTKDGKSYFIEGSTVNLIPYMGSGGAVIIGDVDGNVITVTKVIIGNIIVFDSTPSSNQ
jgi:hypothetical protein